MEHYFSVDFGFWWQQWVRPHSHSGPLDPAVARRLLDLHPQFHVRLQQMLYECLAFYRVQHSYYVCVIIITMKLCYCRQRMSSY